MSDGGTDGAVERPLLGQLLAYVARGTPLAQRNRHFAWRPHGSDERQFWWALDGGLGPLLRHAVGERLTGMPSEWRDVLLSADLSARMHHADRVDTALEVLDACRRLGVAVTLLKGISVSEQIYPAEHLRPMTDIDLLIAPGDYAALESELLGTGFRRMAFTPMPGLHHGIPLEHVGRGVFVELHTGLFPDGFDLREGTTFSPDRLAEHSLPSRYHGRAVRRLSPEFQLVYIASAWFNDLTLERFQPGFVAPLVDAILLTSTFGPAFRSGDLPRWLDNEMARASLVVMASYLQRFGTRLLSPGALTALGSRRRYVGRLQQRLIHATLDRYLIGARAWDLPLPPPVPARYSLNYQFEKRVLGRLARRG